MIDVQTIDPEPTPAVFPGPRLVTPTITSLGPTVFCGEAGRGGGLQRSSSPCTREHDAERRATMTYPATMIGFLQSSRHRSRKNTTSGNLSTIAVHPLCENSALLGHQYGDSFSRANRQSRQRGAGLTNIPRIVFALASLSINRGALDYEGAH